MDAFDGSPCWKLAQQHRECDDRALKIRKSYKILTLTVNKSNFRVS